MRIAVAALLLFTACATQPPPPPLAAPNWDVIPAGVLDALCARLQMDAIATGAPGSPLAIVSTTRPLATPQSLNALAMTVRGGLDTSRLPLSTEELNRAMPVEVANGTCAWRAVPVARMDSHRDEMLVELSAPSIHPFAPKSGGILTRVAVGGEGAAWYWITLIPRGEYWSIGPVHILVN